MRWVGAPAIVDLTANITPQKPTMTSAFEVRQAAQHPRCAVIYAAGFNKVAAESGYRQISFHPSADDEAGYLCPGRSADRNLGAEVAYPKDTSA